MVKKKNPWRHGFMKIIQNKSIMKTNNQSFNNYNTENNYGSSSNNAGGSFSGITQSCDLSKSSL